MIVIFRFTYSIKTSVTLLNRWKGHIVNSTQQIHLTRTTQMPCLSKWPVCPKETLRNAVLWLLPRTQFHTIKGCFLLRVSSSLLGSRQLVLINRQLQLRYSPARIPLQCAVKPKVLWINQRILSWTVKRSHNSSMILRKAVNYSANSTKDSLLSRVWGVEMHQGHKSFLNIRNLENPELVRQITSSQQSIASPRRNREHQDNVYWIHWQASFPIEDYLVLKALSSLK